MYAETVELMATQAAKKADLAKNNLWGYGLLSALAGLFVGFGILLIFSVGAPFADDHNPALKLIMGASFGVALSLVIFAGSELFTGNVMVMGFGTLRKKSSWSDLGRVWAYSWVGNLAGSLILAYVAVQAGSLAHAYPFFAKVSAAKMNAPALELILRGALCNALVCLAVWTSARAQSDAAKLVMIFWCLFAFIGSGFEHSVANMTLLAVGLFSSPNDPALSFTGYFYNLGLVSFGNILGALAVLVLPYMVASTEKKYPKVI